MRYMAWLLLTMVLLGCDAPPVEQKSKPIPPDDMSNGPWKNQQQRAGNQPDASQAETPGESD